MVCIYCGSATQVTNSRPLRRNNGVWRRRQCTKCNSVVTTTETVDLTSALRVELSPNQLMPFSRTLLLMSIYDCCKHLPDPTTSADELTNTTIQLLLDKKTAVLSPKEIILTTSEVLSRFDNAAGVQYLAFHPLPK